MHNSKRAREAQWTKRGINLTVEQYDEMLKRQNGVCAICFKTNNKNRLCVDHDHSTGIVRGLLCGFCNRRLVTLRNSPQLLLRAVNYLGVQAGDISKHTPDAVVQAAIDQINRNTLMLASHGRAN